MLLRKFALTRETVKIKKCHQEWDTVPSLRFCLFRAPNEIATRCTARKRDKPGKSGHQNAAREQKTKSYTIAAIKKSTPFSL
jgi:hypothetical protein